MGWILTRCSAMRDERSPFTAALPQATMAGQQLFGREEAATMPEHRSPCPGAGRSGFRSQIEPLSPARWRVEFTARAELREKLDRARELLSHAVPSGDLSELFERALDALLEKETRKRFGRISKLSGAGAERPRKTRTLKESSRHVPVEVERAVWERDAAQCTFVDEQRRRCSERRFLTFEHRQPYARGGPSDRDNLCILCSAHNQASAREAFGPRHIEKKIRARTHRIDSTIVTTQRPLAPDFNQEQALAPDLNGPQSAAADLVKSEAGACDHDQQPLTPDMRQPPLQPNFGAGVLSALCAMGFRRRTHWPRLTVSSPASPGSISTTS